nr:CocE/NonD family hydrolase [Sphingobium sp. SA916]
MRDGVRLATDIAIPSENGVAPAAGHFPTLIVRTPYDKNVTSTFPPDMVAVATMIQPIAGASRGYVVIYQDVRRAHRSEGKLEPMLNETPDCGDLLAWVRNQPWSAGRIAFCGPSYHGGSSMMGTVAAPEGLVTTYLQAPATDQFKSGWVFFDGIFRLHLATQWAIMQSLDPTSHDNPASAAAARDDFRKLHHDEHMTWMTAQFPEGFFDRLLRTTPLKDMPVARHLSFWRQWIDNRENPTRSGTRCGVQASWWRNARWNG